MTLSVLQDSQFQEICNWSNAEKILMPCLMGRDWNAAQLGEIAAIPFVGTIALTFVLRCSTPNQAIPVTDFMIQCWNQTLETVKNVAVKNAEAEGCMVKTLHELLGEQGVHSTPMYVISNSEMFLGAGVLCSEQMRRQLTQHFAQDMLILPASIHEVLAIPADSEIPLLKLRKMVQSVNQSGNRSMQLSDEIYLLRKIDAAFVLIKQDKK